MIVPTLGKAQVERILALIYNGCYLLCGREPDATIIDMRELDFTDLNFLRSAQRPHWGL